MRERPLLIHGFLRSADRYPEHPALEIGELRWSYERLARGAGRLARVILNDAPRRTDGAVAVFASRSAPAYTGVLASLLAGRFYVPLNPAFPAERTRFMLERSGAGTVVVGEDCVHRLPEVLRDITRELLVVVPNHVDLAGLAGDLPRHAVIAAPSDGPGPSGAPTDVDASAPAYLMFTSGTSGTPKGVAVSHRNVTSYVSYVSNWYGISERDRFSQMFDLTFDLSVHDMFVCWDRGACLCVVPEAAKLAPAEFIRRKKLSVWFSVPSVVSMMARLRLLRPGAFPTLRLSLFCGEALPVEIAEAWQAAAPDSVVENLYGPTEATIAITRYRWEPERSADEAVHGMVPIGRVFPGHRVHVEPAAAGAAGPHEGELWLAGPQVTDGYVDEPEKTRERFVRRPGSDETWYRTGDLVRIDDDGCLYFLGRIDHQIKIRGHRVELQEIDHVLSSLDSELRGVAIAWPVRNGVAEQIVAFVAGVGAGEGARIRAHCQARLPRYMIPSRIYFVDRLPLNANGKIDRNALRKRLMEGEDG